jgi:hypothetical protein
MQQLEMLEPAELLRCTTCKETKPVDEFNRDASRGKRRQYRANKCRTCENAKRARHYLSNKTDRERNKKSMKARAHGRVYFAKQKGQLIKKPCEVCGVEEADAHHDDYAKPLEVRWLCRVHHRQWHVKHGEGLNACTVKHWTPPKEARQ